jgi:hypothetical protein
MTSEAASNQQQAEIKRIRRVLMLAWKKKKIVEEWYWEKYLQKTSL